MGTPFLAEYLLWVLAGILFLFALGVLSLAFSMGAGFAPTMVALGEIMGVRSPVERWINKPRPRLLAWRERRKQRRIDRIVDRAVRDMERVVADETKFDRWLK